MAVVDIGSNSIRLLVYEGLVRSAVPLFNEKVLCGLGRSIASTGQLGKQSMERALKALRRFHGLSTQLGAGRLHVIATAAAREAQNGKQFIAEAQEICETDIRILTGKEEAEMAAAGVIAGSYKTDGLAGDLGGGSLELIDIKHQKHIGGATLPLGSLRLIDVSGGNLKRASEFIDDELAKIKWLETGRNRPFYAIGGTWRAFAKLHMAQTHYPLRVVHGYRINTDEALKFAHLVDHLSSSSLEGIDTISRARRETVPYGALVLERLFKRIHPSELIVSSFGVREGLLYSLLPKAEMKRDPLLAVCEDLAGMRSRSLENSYELCAWTDALFKKSGPKETQEEKRLRHAACLLADIGWRGDEEYRAKHSLDLIAHGVFSGIDHPGRAFLAMAIYFRHEGLVKDLEKDELSAKIVRLIDKHMLKRARIIGAAIRVAHMISAGMPGIIEHTPIRYKGKKLVLHLAPPYNILQGERLTRRLKALAGQLECEHEICTHKKSAGELIGV